MIPLIEPMMPRAEDVVEWLEGCLDRGIWSNFGPVHDIAEAMARQYTGGSPLLCSSGMTALQAAISTMVSWSAYQGQTIAVSDYSHAGSLLPVQHAKFRPVLVACDPVTRAMDLGVFEGLCREGLISGAVITNPFGRGIDRKSYSAIARQHGVTIVYDYAGAWGDFDIGDEFPTVYSFHATKSVPIGEGGLVVFSKEVDYQRARRYINFGTGPDRRIIEDGGINGKMSEISAAVVCAQLDPKQHKWIRARLERRSDLQEIYSREIENVHVDGLFPDTLSLCTVCLPGLDLTAFEAKSALRGFVSKQYYVPLRSMPAFTRLNYAGFPAAELDHCLGLPSDVSDAAALVICGEIHEIIKELQSQS